MPPTNPRRVQVAITNDVADALTVLSCEPSSQPVGAALTAYARAIEHATASASQALCRAEWNYLADALNGCWHVQDLAGLSARVVLLAEVEDAHRLNRLGDKWLPTTDEVTTDDQVRVLLLTLSEMSEIEAQAVLLAVRHFWSHPEIDHTAGDWWTTRRVTRRRKE